jgi:hypothetical protein
VKLFFGTFDLDVEAFEKGKNEKRIKRAKKRQFFRGLNIVRS